VIDNYGDAGVCWRLARQLHHDYRLKVCLWIDHLPVLQQMQAGVQLRDRQSVDGIELRLWNQNMVAPKTIANLVIEAFGCVIPDNYIKEMHVRKLAGHRQYWINLDYLSAESWTENYHGLASIEPITGLRKYFFFPGFSPQVGGLLREKLLLSDRNSFSKKDQLVWLKQHLITPLDNELLVSLFAYENPSLPKLLKQWESNEQPIGCLVPASAVLKTLNSHYGLALSAGDHIQRGALRLHILPFLQQQDYDRLLWTCDLNFVRGEDSFVRAHWAGKPFVWQIYKQDDGSHRLKLEAFLKQLCAAMPVKLQVPFQSFWQEWNEFAVSQSWPQLFSMMTEWRSASARWAGALESQPDLCQRMVEFCIPSHQC
jgi:uncharacterized repeat protein (TIGR03837 family)